MRPLQSRSALTGGSVPPTPQPGGFECLGFLMVEVDLDSPGEPRIIDGQDRPRSLL
jgi:hypothetical protein